MLVQYYEDRLIVVGTNWYGQPCSCTYTLSQKDADYLYPLFENTDFIKDWCTKYAGDFLTITDFQLEVFEKTKLFDSEDSWLDIN
jgi:hypothetical protein